MVNKADMRSKCRNSADAMQHIELVCYGMTGMLQMACSIGKVPAPETAARIVG